MRLILAAFMVVFLVHASSIAYYGPGDPELLVPLTSMTNLVSDCNGTPMELKQLTFSPLTAANELKGDPSVVAVLLLSDAARHYLVVEAAEELGMLVVSDNLAVPPPSSPLLYYGGLSFLDQLAAFVHTRVRLPALDMTDLVIIIDTSLTDQLDPVIDLLNNISRKEPSIIIVSATTSLQTVLAQLEEKVNLEVVAAAIAFVFRRNSAAIVNAVIRKVYAPATSVSFFLTDDLIHPISESLAADPLIASYVYPASIEAFTMTQSDGMQSWIENLIGGPIKLNRNLIWAYTSITFIADGVGRICFRAPPTATLRAELPAAVPVVGRAATYLNGEQRVGPTMCDDIIDNCMPCQQLSRVAYRKVIAMDGSIDMNPTTASVLELSRDVCRFNHHTDPLTPHVVFSVFFQQTVIYSLMSAQKINFSRQNGLYSAIDSFNSLGGLQGRSLIPQTLRQFSSGSVDRLHDVHISTGGSFIVSPLLSEQNTILALVNDVLDLQELHGISMLIYGSQLWRSDAFLVPGTTRRNPQYLGSIPDFSNVAAAIWAFNKARGTPHMVAVLQAMQRVGDTLGEFNQHMQHYQDHFIGGDTSYTYRGFEGDPLNSTYLEYMVDTVHGAVDPIDGPVTIFVDDIQSVPLGSLLCRLSTEFPDADILMFSVDPYIEDETECPAWRERAFMLSRWPHYSIPTPISDAYQQSIMSFDQHSDHESYEKWLQTRLLTTVLDISLDATGNVTFQSVLDTFYTIDSFYVYGMRFGPFSAVPDDPTVANGDVCNCITKTFFVQKIAEDADPHHPTFVPTAEFGLDPVLDWYPYCNFFIPPVVAVAGSSLIALWISLGAVSLSVIFLLICFCCWLWIVVIFVSIVLRLRKKSRRYRVLKEKAEEASLQKSMFVSNMSHELRTPLNAIIGTIDIIKSSVLTDNQQQALAVIGGSAQILLAVINDVLFAARLASGQVSRESTESTVAEVLEVSAVSTQHPIREGVQLLFFYQPGTPYRVRCDATHMTRVLTSIIDNAAKVTETGAIWVTVGPEHVTPHKSHRWGRHHCVEPAPCQMLRFTVEDSGRGIPAEDLDRVFEQFIRLGKGTNINVAGTGLGLHIAKRLVETILCGDIEAGSSDDLGGASFTFTCAAETLGDGPVDPDAGPVVLLNAPTDTPGPTPVQLSASSTLRHMGLPEAAVIVQPPGEAWVTEDPDVGQAARALVCSLGVDHVELTAGLPAANVSYISGEDALTIPFTVDGLSEMLQPGGSDYISPVPCPPTPSDRKALRSWRVLVAEDDSINRMTVRMFLKRIGFTNVKLFENGDELVRHIQDNGPPDLVILDYHMPVMDGYTCSRWVKDTLGDAVITILMTADVTITNENHTFDAVTYKPLMFSTFSALVTEMVENRPLAVVEDGPAIQPMVSPTSGGTVEA